MRGCPRFRDPSTRLPENRLKIQKPVKADPKSLFVGNLSFSISSADLIQIFQKYGRVSEVFLPCFPGTSKPRGYGFVRFMYEDDARAAKGVLDGQKIDGRPVSVKDARPKPFRRSEVRRSPIREAVISRDRGQCLQNVKGFELGRNRGREKPQIPSPDRCPAGLITIAESVSKKLQDLELGLVAYSGNKTISVLQLIDGLRSSRFRASAIDVTRLSVFSFLLSFKSKAELFDCLAHPSFGEKLGLTEVLPWSPDIAVEEAKSWICLFGILTHAWSEPVIRDLGSSYGEVVQMDTNTRLGIFQMFARIKIRRLARPFTPISQMLDVQGKIFRIWAQMEAAPLEVESCARRDSVAGSDANAELSKHWVSNSLGANSENSRL